MTIDFKEVVFGSSEYKELLGIRNEVLRKPIGMELRPKDIATDGQEYHLGAFDNGKAIGCVLLRPLTDGCIQLRQMAIYDSHRGQNIGQCWYNLPKGLQYRNNSGLSKPGHAKPQKGFIKNLVTRHTQMSLKMSIH